MIKIISAAYHSNIGDHRGSIMLAAYIESLTGIKTKLVGYKIPMTKDFIKKLNFNADAIVIGNGGLLMQAHGKYNLFTPEDKYLRDIITAPVIIWSTGFNHRYGINFKPEWTESTHWLLQRADLIGLRTRYDIQYASDLVDREYDLCPDPLLFIGNIQSDVVDYKVGICLRKERPRLMSVISKYTSNIVVLNHETSNKKLSLNKYADLDFVITDRFHGCVFAIAFGKPFYAIDFNIKIGGIIDLMSCIFSGSNECPELGLNNFIAAKEAIRGGIQNKLEIYRRDYINFAIKATELIING